MKGTYNNISYIVKVNEREDLGGFAASFSFTSSTNQGAEESKAYELMNSDKSLSIFKSQEDATHAAERCAMVCIDDGFIG
ncbi:hypothetical protein [Grimontia marina]|uniref:Uncharacterized protein n=1 Tax=Grimontia marina TaxID=646534 RepID=A0A128FFN1_9GAMM|nr:hypothetical protein [Grimontia marina]CZF85602.1 hypothetical protein GMA8713_03644 [Grimontia marina]